MLLLDKGLYRNPLRHMDLATVALKMFPTSPFDMITFHLHMELHDVRTYKSIVRRQ